MTHFGTVSKFSIVNISSIAQITDTYKVKEIKNNKYRENSLSSAVQTHCSASNKRSLIPKTILTLSSQTVHRVLTAMKLFGVNSC